MKATLTKSGGWSATLRLPKRVVDSAALSESESSEFARLVEAAKSETPHEVSEPGRDVLHYELTLETEGKQTVLSQSDLNMTKPFRALMKWLESHGEVK